MREQEYTSQQPGFRLVFVALVVAAILGLSFRLYFSSQRMKTWIEAELTRRPSPVQISFDAAEFSLARGMIPQIAIRLVNVHGRSVKSCSEKPGVRISELFIPFRMMSLLRGDVAIGVIHGENLSIDIDAVKKCEAPISTPAETANAAVSAASQASVEPSNIRPWWSAEQWEKVTSLVAGISFSHVTMTFEQQQKYVAFDDFMVTPNTVTKELSLTTEVHVPPNLVLGQSIPAFALEVVAKADSADLQINGHIGEGGLQGLATVKAIPNDVQITAHLSISQVPLSTVFSYLEKKGNMSKDIRPRFLWVNCEASVTGAAKGLLKNNPVVLERCAIEGDSAQVLLDRAVIGPGNKLEPFAVNISKIDMRKFFALINRQGPSGIMQNFGSLTGKVNIRALDDLDFAGELASASFIFSQQAVRYLQPVPTLLGTAAFKRGVWDVAITGANVTGGKFEGTARVHFDENRDGKIDLNVKELAFHPDIQRLLTKGYIENMSLNGMGSFERGKFQGFNGKVEMRRIKGSDLEAPDARATLKIEEHRASGKMVAGSGRLRRNSEIFNILKPVLFGHKFRDDWIAVKDFEADFNLENRVFTWKNASVIIPEAVLKMRSSGSVNDGDQILASLQADYPTMKDLRWDVSGSLFGPTFQPTSNTRSHVHAFENR